MNIPIWTKSWYVTYIGLPSFLSSGGLAPPKWEGRPPLCALTFRIASIAHSFRLLNHIILFSLSVLANTAFIPLSYNSPLNYFQCLRSLFHRGFFSLNAVPLPSIEPCRQFCPLFLRQPSFLWPDRDKPFRECVPLRHNLPLIGFHLPRPELLRILLRQLVHFTNPYRVCRVNLRCILCRIKAYGYFLFILWLMIFSHAQNLLFLGVRSGFIPCARVV